VSDVSEVSVESDDVESDDDESDVVVVPYDWVAQVVAAFV
jgi:hypothetical protein